MLHYGPVPAFDPATWDFRVWGEVEQERCRTWDEFNQLPRTITMDLHCVTRWSKVDTLWEGVRCAPWLKEGLITPKPTAHFVMQYAEYGFTVNLPLEVVLQENFLLATHYDDEPLTPEHGYPLRGVVGAIPGREDLATPYLWKGAKWLRGWSSCCRPAGFLGESRLSQQCRCLEGRTLRVKTRPLERCRPVIVWGAKHPNNDRHTLSFYLSMRRM